MRLDEIGLVWIGWVKEGRKNSKVFAFVSIGLVWFGLVWYGLVGLGLVWFGIVPSPVRTCMDGVNRTGKYLRLQANAVSSERSVARLGWVGLGWDGIFRCGDPGGGVGE